MAQPVRVYINGQLYIGGYTVGPTGIIKYIGVPDDADYDYVIVRKRKVKIFNFFKKPKPVVDITLTESIIVQKAKSQPDKLTLKEIAALKKIVERVENDN